MKKYNLEKELKQLTCPDEDTAERISEAVPVLDDAAKERILNLCERKMNMKKDNINLTNDENYVDGVEPYNRPKWFKYASAAAACLILAGGIVGIYYATKGPDNSDIKPDNPIHLATVTEDDTDKSSESEPKLPTAPVSTLYTEPESTVPTVPPVAEPETVTETVPEPPSVPTPEPTEAPTAPPASAPEPTEAPTAPPTPEPTEAPTEVQVEYSAMQSEMESLFAGNLRCLDLFRNRPLSTIGEPLDGVSIYQVDTSEFASYAELESYVYSVYTDSTANMYLTSFPRQGRMYLEYDGKLCIDTYNVLDGFGYYVDWSSYEINVTHANSSSCTFEVTAMIQEPGDLPPEPYTVSCTAFAEDGGWRLEKMYY
ncbi:MAG: hypothetical protein IJX77_08170 [Ruminococcus sp.]|nr:hypothetical protein [Ruminococcus sp.]